MELFDVAILKGTLKNPMDAVILAHSASLWSHGTILLDREIEVNGVKGDQVEATVGGVQLSYFSKYDYRDCKIIRFENPIPQTRQEKMLQWLISKIGCKYEYKSFPGYLTGTEIIKDDPTQFVCVELCSELFTENDIPLWGAETPTFIYPVYLLINPKFKLVEERKGIQIPKVEPIENQLITGPC